MTASLLGHVENPSDKILFTQVIMTAPGQCAICGSGQDQNGFVDTGLDFEFWGRVFFCPQCTGQIAAVFGFISPADYDDLQGERDLAQLELRRANETIENMRRIVDGLRGISLLNPIPSVPVTEFINVEDVQEPPESVFAPIQPTSESIEPDVPEPTKTGKSSGKPGLLNI